MSSVIKQAIIGKHKVRLEYKDGSCIVEPYAFGIDSSGEPLLLCFQAREESLHGDQGDWKVVHVTQLISITPINEPFRKIRSGYVPHHPAFHTVLIQV